MWIKDIFSKRKPSYLVIYVNYQNLEVRLYKILSSLTYSIGPLEKIDDIKKEIKIFNEKYPFPLKDIVLTSYGRGKNLIETTESKEKFYELMDSLKPLMDDNTKISFTTCFTGVSYRNAVELSEYFGGREILAMSKDYILNGKMTKCSCKEKGYSKKIINSLPNSRNGLRYDERQMVEIIKRDEGEEINWLTCGMSYEYNQRIKKDGICVESKQSINLIKGILNYLFNIQ